jgi:hypothetical protein
MANIQDQENGIFTFIEIQKPKKFFTLGLEGLTGAIIAGKETDIGNSTFQTMVLRWK